MNIERINQAIAIMKRAGAVNMFSWQGGWKIEHTEEELHECGNSACFAGWVAVSPEWAAFGGGVRRDGQPYRKGATYLLEEPEEGIAAWLEIDPYLAEGLMFPSHGMYSAAGLIAKDAGFYANDLVEAEHVIAALELIRDGRLVAVDDGEFMLKDADE